MCASQMKGLAHTCAGTAVPLVQRLTLAHVLRLAHCIRVAFWSTFGLYLWSTRSKITQQPLFIRDQWGVLMRSEYVLRVVLLSVLAGNFEFSAVVQCWGFIGLSSAELDFVVLGCAVLGSAVLD